MSEHWRTGQILYWGNIQTIFLKLSIRFLYVLTFCYEKETKIVDIFVQEVICTYNSCSSSFTQSHVRKDFYSNVACVQTPFRVERLHAG